MTRKSNKDESSVTIDVTEYSKEICELEDKETLRSAVEKICDQIIREAEYIKDEFPDTIESKEIVRLHIRALMNARRELSVHAEIVCEGGLDRIGAKEVERVLNVRADKPEELKDKLTITL